MGDDERQADEETVLLAAIHCCYTVVLHCCYTVVTLLLQYCYNIVTLLLHCYYTIAWGMTRGRLTSRWWDLLTI
jgi:hypothetical protein